MGAVILYSVLLGLIVTPVLLLVIAAQLRSQDGRASSELTLLGKWLVWFAAAACLLQLALMGLSQSWHIAAAGAYLGFGGTFLATLAGVLSLVLFLIDGRGSEQPVSVLAAIMVTGMAALCCLGGLTGI